MTPWREMFAHRANRFVRSHTPFLRTEEDGGRRVQDALFQRIVIGLASRGGLHLRTGLV